MATESEKDLGDTAGTEPVTSTDNEAEMKKKKKKKKGLLSRMWNSLFGSHKDDFEKRLQHIFKEEVVVISRTVKRSHSWRRMSRHLIILSVLFEFVFTKKIASFIFCFCCHNMSDVARLSN